METYSDLLDCNLAVIEEYRRLELNTVTIVDRSVVSIAGGILLLLLHGDTETIHAPKRAPCVYLGMNVA